MKKLKKLTLNVLQESAQVLSPTEQSSIIGGGTVYKIGYGTIEDTGYGVWLETDSGYGCFFSGVKIEIGGCVGKSAYQLNGTIHISESWINDPAKSFTVYNFMHEYGHYMQQDYGGNAYYTYVGGTSAIVTVYDYFFDTNYAQGLNVEQQADLLGQVFFDYTKSYLNY